MKMECDYLYGWIFVIKKPKKTHSYSQKSHQKWWTQEIKWGEQIKKKTCYLTKSQHTDTRLTSPSADLLTQGHHRECLDGQVVKASVQKVEGPEFELRLWRDFSGSSHTSDLKIGTPVRLAL